ncbi:polyprenyl diphosphate synthase [Legionella spiritensis]|uniref:Ditrans,polycis-undecaprenyl-diphosphate synthase ((2E,6E)-farnesyl-diphosphate specific) n=1 Tax=Legionella spiritensis TaxID=452 RepID=A0A0W0ZA13_LEGSP|nr:polyprenyl diphosphate synthase [Legionella spiritensis]KTD65882.1 undecaprenyl pyrophosphate synthase [Legionella spiritensis]SNV32062.1 undecaprenyl pyrophosphate synthetase [Legionella spiritensis]
MNKVLPQHVAIVMDGNGRWAENRGLLRFEGHKAGIASVKTVIRCCLENNISVLSLFAFSSENWARPENEVEFLMKLFLETLRYEVEELHKNAICLRFTGNRQGLSPDICEQMAIAETLTRDNKRLTLNLVLNYGGKWEIVEATKKIAQKVCASELQISDIDESILSRHLNTWDLPEPDFFIRTSGEHRISNFFLWQLAYTELYFTSTHWPDFNAEEFEKALLCFRQRERRYGKTSRQINETEHV